VNAIDPDLVAGYLVRTRWFAGKGRPFAVRSTEEVGALSGGTAGPVVTVYIVDLDYRDDEGGTERYQVPLSAYGEFEERIAHAYVGPIEEGGRTRHLFDAVHDRDAMALWLEALVAAEASGDADVGGLRFHRVPGSEPLDPALRASAMTGEQSNSSVRFDDTAIMKIFRKLSPGTNPDIEIHDVLTRAGSTSIAPLAGWVDADLDGETVQLAMVQEFLHTATDGFELALASVRTLLADPEHRADESGGDFAGEAARLGDALAEVHALLRDSFPAERRGPAEAAALAGEMTARLDAAVRVVPELEPYAPRLRAVFARVAELDGLDVQRVHGDLHLGQTLRTSHGWRIVDFEGEPGRPFDERSLPDSPWRDLAGMLRSFDYAPGVIEMSMTGEHADDGERLRGERAREWSERARRHFVEAYRAAVQGDAPLSAEQRTLLDAYVADKAVYEAVYEKRNRPAWIHIPLGALTAIAAGTSAAG